MLLILAAVLYFGGVFGGARQPPVEIEAPDVQVPGIVHVEVD